ncbi:hypothetical protein LCGC14_1589670 [marine sediment metagenome]|uniref:4Fe-4S ferredoxin-type domain-containing protein n=1 Tax=marine sediment metagenome TaxID=412755 RepID=A0A0F9J0L2_9ZZZZ
MSTYYVPQVELQALLSGAEGISIFASSPDASMESLSCPRGDRSPKGFFLPAVESVGQYGPAATATETQADPVALVGVRACELRARSYLDQVLLAGDVEDPMYRRRRDRTVLVSCDCTDCAESCFCTQVGGEPFARDGYDVNLTSVDGGFLVDVATDAGRGWLGNGRASQLAEATDDQLARRDQLRREMTERVANQNQGVGPYTSDRPPALPNDGDEAWQAFAADCVECGACTHICPTCHCFYLYDQSVEPGVFERVRTWDSCLLSTYHRMAGGVNMKLTPRPRLLSRLANRVLHKFTYSPQQYSLVGCVGCGRCVDACVGAIDIREVVKELGQ